MVLLRRLVGAAGVLAALAALLQAFLVDSSIWFYDGVIQGSLSVAASIVLVCLVAEVVGHFFSGVFMQAWLLIVVATAVAVPNFYLYYAAVFGTELAELQTWNLLPFFVLYRQARAVVVVGTVIGGACLLYLGGRHLMSPAEDSPLLWRRGPTRKT